VRGTADIDGCVGLGDAGSANVSPKEERRRLKLEVARTQALDAAEHAFATAGFHNTTIKSIAELCEIAVGTLYILFEDKQRLYEAVLRRRGEALKSLTELKAAESGRADAKLVELAELLLQFFREHRDWTTVASSLVSGSRAAQTSSGASQMYEGGHRVVADSVSDVMARGQHDGHIRAGDPLALALIFLGMLETYWRICTVAVGEPVGDAGHGFRPVEFLDLVRAAFSTSRNEVGTL